jgi:pantoate--beta-alanine ligase
MVRDIDALRRRIDTWRDAHKSVALVPTMGALHKGHLTLMARAQQMADRVVATIFVNPKQFGPREDFAAYPRRETEDFQMLSASGVHVLFAPEPTTMYPRNFATTVRVRGLSTILDGAHRPGHFDGVATVVTKLLLQAAPDIALFGEKDYQQLAIIKRLALDLNIRSEIIGVPTVREDDGLAMSSRNAYLTEDERARAPALYRAITAAAHDIADGGDIARALAAAKEKIRDAGFADVDYVEARHAETLAVLKKAREPGRVLAAARLGRARLIDNVPIVKAE